MTSDYIRLKFPVSRQSPNIQIIVDMTSDYSRRLYSTDYRLCCLVLVSYRRN